MKNSLHPLIEYRCRCNKLLFKGMLLTNSIEIKCKRCSRITVFGNGTGGERISRASPEYVSMLVDSSDQILDLSDSFSQLPIELQKKIRGEHQETRPNPGAHSNSSEQFIVRKHTRDLGASQQRLQIYEIMKPVSLVLRDAPPINELAIYSYTAEIDRSGRYTYVSNELCELIGCDTQELFGKSIFDSFMPLDGGLYASWYSELLPTHCAYALNPVHILSTVENNKKNPSMKVIFIPLYSDMAFMRGYTVLFDAQSTASG